MAQRVVAELFVILSLGVLVAVFWVFYAEGI